MTQPDPTNRELTFPKVMKLAPFLNTGHHFFQIPLPPEASQQLRDAAKTGRCPWINAIAVTSGQRGKMHLWLRGRVHKDPEEAPVLHLCIDSNTGDDTQGWVTAPPSDHPQDTLNRINKKQASKQAYIFKDISSAPQTLTEMRVCFDVPSPDGTDTLVLDLAFEFPPPNSDPVDVDLIIDFGNTRSVVLALEDNKQASGYLSQVCMPIEFCHRTHEPIEKSGPISYSRSIIDSWFVLAEPIFSNLEPPGDTERNECPAYLYRPIFQNNQRGIWPFRKGDQLQTGYQSSLPNVCVQMSPAVMGTEAERILPQIPLHLGGNAFLSSPKRYSWDTDPVGNLGNAGCSFWTMHIPTWHPRRSNYEAEMEFPKLAATALLLMDEDGRDWSRDPSGNGPIPTERLSAAARPSHSPDAPSYPRSDALTWAALAIIENSYRYIMSDCWRKKMQTKFVPRRIRNILVTYPSGWTGQELSSYQAKWKKAIDIFSVTHLGNNTSIKDNGCRPNLLLELDEAVASQLPIIYEEISRFGNVGENWIQFMGRGTGKDARVRIMNLDIGGGTTDVSVIEYRDELAGYGVQLTTQLLFKDSNTVAGDTLVRSIIESVLLPALAQPLTDEQRKAFSEFLVSIKGSRTARWNRVTRQVLIPIVRRWLADLTTDCKNDPATGLPPRPFAIIPTQDVIEEMNMICQEAIGVAGILDGSLPLDYDQSALEGCIASVFTDLLSSMGKICESFDCDLLFVSGKPSELPGLKEIVEIHIPLLPSRIIFAHGYQVGPWYPLPQNGRIGDAKTVTVAGAALYQAIKLQLLNQWRIKPSAIATTSNRNFWGIMPPPGQRDFITLILKPTDDEGTITTMVGSRIGRRFLPTRSRPDPVYILRWRPETPQENRGSFVVNARIQRIVPDISQTGTSSRFDAIGESLKLLSIEGSRDDGTPITIQEIELQLCTMDAQDHWIDTGIFYLNLSES
jgi:hypothetical protein